MKRKCFLLVLIPLLAACMSTPPSPTLPPETISDRPTPTPWPTPVPTETAEPTHTPTSTLLATDAPVPSPAASATLTATPPVIADLAGLPLPVERGTYFVGSGVCASCHSQMTDQTGMDVSIDSAWRSTMMANAARDPYWRATVRSEVLKNPTIQAIIEEKCATCHTPMTHFTVATGGQDATLLDAGFFDPGHPLHQLAQDGVSCTLCHQIQDLELGQVSSFSGHYIIDENERVTFGPFPVGRQNANLMKLASNFTPVESQHIRQAALCATCHTLFTPYLDSNDEIGGEFPEQTPFLEWIYSDYRDRQSCQDCHMPGATGGVVLSTTGGPPRAPFARHNFVGGNTYMLAILRAFGQEQQVTAANEHFDATIARVQEQLQDRTAELSLENVLVDQGVLTGEIVLSSLVGHKFPSGFPARRAWLHLVASDANGAIIFESGATSVDGIIAGNDNDSDEARFEPHHAIITDPGQVQIYEAIMGTSDGLVTTTLLRGASYLKDNRLLPAGFAKDTALADIAVHGAALDDPDFMGGGDRVRFEITLNDAVGPYLIEVELLYQAVSYRWAQNLAPYAGPEIERFLAYYDAIPNTPFLVSSAATTAGD